MAQAKYSGILHIKSSKGRQGGGGVVVPAAFNEDQALSNEMCSKNTKDSTLLKGKQINHHPPFHNKSGHF